MLDSEDTSPEARRILVEGYRRMSVAEKARRVDEMTVAARDESEEATDPEP